MLTIKRTIYSVIISSMLFGCGGISKSTVSGENQESNISSVSGENQDNNTHTDIDNASSIIKDNENNQSNVKENHLPTASDISIIGTAKTGETLTLKYTFEDEDGDAEGKSIIAWSTPTKELQRGQSKTFKIPAEYTGDSIGAWVHPVDEHGGKGEGYSASNNMLSIQTNGERSDRNAPIPVDKTVPVITLLGKSSISIKQGSTYTDEGARAQDNIDGDISENISTNNSVDTSIAATYTVTYSVKDKSNNSALEVTRTVTVTSVGDEITTVPLFIIGDSTVDNYRTAAEDVIKDKKIIVKKGQRLEMGWGNVIHEFMVNPDMKYNHARSGVSTLTYASVVPTWSHQGFWGDGETLTDYGNMGLKQRIIETDTTKGGFLLIQLGHNDAASGETINATKETVPEVNLNATPTAPSNMVSYESNLRLFINHALEHGVTPVLITPVSRMYPRTDGCCCPKTEEYEGMSACSAQHIFEIKANSTNPFAGQVLDYPKALKKLQKEYANKDKKVILLDLTKASMEQFLTIIAPGETRATMNSVMAKYAYDNADHFNPFGARMVAGLIKDLACEKDQELCAQFK